MNKDLQSKFEQGVIFTLDVPQCIDFFILDKMKIKRELPQISRVEEFKIENRLKPTGLVLTVFASSLLVHNFDENLNKKANSCAIVSSVSLTDGSSPITKVAISSNQDVVMALHEDFLLTSFMIKNGEII